MAYSAAWVCNGLKGKVVLCTLRRYMGKVRTAVFSTAFGNG